MITVQTFNKFYWDQKLSYRLVAEKLGIHVDVLRSWIHKHRSILKLRSKSEALKLAFKEGRHNLTKEKNPRWSHGYEGQDRYRWDTFKITPDQYQDMLESQEHSCMVCNLPFGEDRINRPNIDHCHVTDMVRGLLCNNCNAGLGFFKDRVESLNNAIDYLKGRRRWDKRLS